jgi:hypothetical protein
MGEHSDREVAALLKNVDGMPMDSYYLKCSNCRDWHGERNFIVREVKDSANYIRNY